jgi:hypothetical protein
VASLLDGYEYETNMLLAEKKTIFMDKEEGLSRKWQPHYFCGDKKIVLS